MTDTYPNPWDFHNIDKALASPDDIHSIVYYNLNEIAMGAPIGGQCFLETKDNLNVKIHDWCGGPPVWETDGGLFAIPVWTRKLLKGTVQQIGIANIITMEFKIFTKIFRVLDLRSFCGKTIYGYETFIVNLSQRCYSEPGPLPLKAV